MLSESALDPLQENNIELAVDRINNFMNDMHRCALKLKCKPNNTNIMDNANEKYIRNC